MNNERGCVVKRFHGIRRKGIVYQGSFVTRIEPVEIRYECHNIYVG